MFRNAKSDCVCLALWFKKKKKNLPPKQVIKTDLALDVKKVPHLS